MVVIGAVGWAVGGGGQRAARWIALCLAVTLVIGLYAAAIAAGAVNSPGSRAYLPIAAIVFAGLYAPALVTAWRAESPVLHRLRFFSAGGLLVAVVVIAVELDQSSVHQPWGRLVQVGVILLAVLVVLTFSLGFSALDGAYRRTRAYWIAVSATSALGVVAVIFAVIWLATSSGQSSSD